MLVLKVRRGNFLTAGATFSCRLPSVQIKLNFDNIVEAFMIRQFYDGPIGNGLVEGSGCEDSQESLLDLLSWQRTRSNCVIFLTDIA